MARGTGSHSTLRHPALWLGLAGSVTIAVGELSRLTSWRRVGAPRGTSAAQLGPHWWTDDLTRLAPSDESWMWILVGVIALSVAWWWLRPPARGNLRLGLVFAVWTLPLLALPPMFSTDAGSYADLGWTINQGLDPYVQGLGTTGGPFPYGTAWRGTTSVYPPGSLMLFAGITQLTGMHWYWSVVALRVLALAGAAGLAWALPALARRVGVNPTQVLWLGLLNPVTLVHGVGGEHIDLLMAGLVAVALVVAIRRGVILGAVVLGLAVAVKQPALLALPSLGVLGITAGHARRPGWLRVLLAWVVGGAVVAGTFAAITWASGLGYGWLDGTGVPTRARQTLSTAYLLSHLTSDVGGWNTALAWAGCGVVAALGVMVLRQRPLTFLGYAALTYLVCFSVMREWYAIFPLAFIALARPPAWLVTGLGFVATFLALYGDVNEYHRLGEATANARAAGILALLALSAGSALALIQRRVRTARRRARTRTASPLAVSEPADAEVAAEQPAQVPSATKAVGAV